MKNSPPTIAVCIPAYGRPDEFALLLQSIVLQTVLPDEVIVCEDGSEERLQLKELFNTFAKNLPKDSKCHIRFIENPMNMGYDGNLRTLIAHANSDYIFFIGNDDYILVDGIANSLAFLVQHPVLAASRSFARFNTDPHKPIGYSRLWREDLVHDKNSATAGMMLRIGGFFGGLIFNREWAQSMATARYDGTLYYQIYLLLHASTRGSIGYISIPTVAARADNAPLFGSASAEKGSFVPGRYTVQARGKMWESILQITADCEQQTGQPMLESMRQELAGRMSFHVFEMFAGRPTSELKALRQELERLGLFNHRIAKTCYLLNRSCGRHARGAYTFARWLLQR